MPITISSPTQTKFALPHSDPTSSHASSSNDDSSPIVESPIYSPTSPLSPSFKFRPGAETPQLSALGAMQGSSQAASDHRLMHRQLKAAYLARAFPRGAESARNPLRDEIAESEASELGEESAEEVTGLSEARDVEDMQGSAAEMDADPHKEVEEDKAINSRVIAVDFDALCARYMPGEIEHIAEIQAQVEHKDRAKLPDQPSSSSSAAPEPGFVAACKQIKSLGYRLHLLSAHPESDGGEIEGLLKAYGITVGVEKEDVITAVWFYTHHDMGEASTKRDAAIGLQQGDSAAASGELAKLPGGTDEESRSKPLNVLRAIKPLAMITSPHANAERFLITDTPAQEPNGEAVKGENRLRIAVLTFGREYGAEVHTDRFAAGIGVAHFSGWDVAARSFEV